MVMDFFCIGVVLHKSHLDYGICVFCDAYRQYNESGGPGQFKKPIETAIKEMAEALKNEMHKV
jgi:hypothetical protein